MLLTYEIAIRIKFLNIVKSLTVAVQNNTQCENEADPREKTDVEAPSDHCPMFTSKEHCSW